MINKWEWRKRFIWAKNNHLIHVGSRSVSDSMKNPWLTGGNKKSFHANSDPCYFVLPFIKHSILLRFKKLLKFFPSFPNFLKTVCINPKLHSCCKILNKDDFSCRVRDQRTWRDLRSLWRQGPAVWPRWPPHVAGPAGPPDSHNLKV